MSFPDCATVRTPPDRSRREHPTPVRNAAAPLPLEDGTAVRCVISPLCLVRCVTGLGGTGWNGDRRGRQPAPGRSISVARTRRCAVRLCSVCVSCGWCGGRRELVTRADMPHWQWYQLPLPTGEMSARSVQWGGGLRSPQKPATGHVTLRRVGGSGHVVS